MSLSMPNSLLHFAATVLSLASIVSCQSVHVEIRLDYRTTEQEDSSCFEQNKTSYSGQQLVQLEHRFLNSSFGDSLWGEWTPLRTIDLAGTIQDEVEPINLTSFDQTTLGVQLRLLQLEHGGGGCSCWELEEFSVILWQQDSGNDSAVVDPRAKVAFGENFTARESAICHSEYRNDTLFCGGSSYEARGLILKALYLPAANESDRDLDDVMVACPRNSGKSLFKAPFPENCSRATPRIDLAYQLVLDVDSELDPLCGGISGLDEAIVFAIRFNKDVEWIPLRMTHHSDSTDDGTMLAVWGYTVPAFGRTEAIATEHVSVCGERLRDADTVQFRWMQMARLEEGERGRSDMWAVAILSASLTTSKKESGRDLLQNSYDSTLRRYSVWNVSNSGGQEGNCSLCMDTVPCSEGGYLTFGGAPEESETERIAETRVFSLIEQPPTTSAATQPLPSTTSAETTSEFLSIVSGVQQKVNENKMLREILSSDPVMAVDMLDGLLDQEPAILIYLLGTALNNYNESEAEDEFVEPFLNILNYLLTSQEVEVNEVGQDVTASSCLLVMYRLVFEVLPETFNRTVDNNLGIKTQQLLNTSSNPLKESYIPAVNSTKLFNNEVHPEITVEIPFGLAAKYADNSSRLISFLYYNVVNLFPTEFEGMDNGTLLASGVVSTALDCGRKNCPTDKEELNTPVLITLHHSKDAKEMMEADKNSSIRCVFWEFLNISNDSTLSIGEWSERGCRRNEHLSNSSVTVCECDHLTLFAILLIPGRIPNPPEDVSLSLHVLTYIGVAVSVFAMMLTVFTFLVLKSLRNMRSYIHINLCINLSIAQLIFVAGVDQSGSDHVPIHCQIIAVLLHYFFLVSFMWMLMEGVVLYIILVRVFIARPKLYRLVFMLVSYGLPLLYMGLTLPLGFALPEQPNYGYNDACFLNPDTNFTWTFIVPVLVILLANIVFLMMAAYIICRHKARQTGKNMTAKHFKGLLKALISLAVVMGLTWLFGVLVSVKRPQVFQIVVLYVYTVMVAFQGVWIFLLFVLCSKQVREEYMKLWRKPTPASYNNSTFRGRLNTANPYLGSLKSADSNSLRMNLSLSRTLKADEKEKSLNFSSLSEPSQVIENGTSKSPET